MTMVTFAASSGIASRESIHLFQQKIGSALFDAVTTRLDIAFTLSKLLQFLTNPSAQHHEAATRLLEYLFATKEYAIQYEEGDMEVRAFLCYSDASFADNKDRKSSQGWIMTLFGGPIAWKASKQATVTTSSTEAELLALSETTKEAMYLRRLFEAIGLRLDEDLAIDCDNTQTINLVTKDDMKLNTRLRHVDIHNHWLRQEYREGRVNIRWLKTDQMPADGLTKALPRQKHEAFIKLVGMMDISSRLDNERKLKELRKRVAKDKPGTASTYFATTGVHVRSELINSIFLDWLPD